MYEFFVVVFNSSSHSLSSHTNTNTHTYRNFYRWNVGDEFLRYCNSLPSNACRPRFISLSLYHCFVSVCQSRMHLRVFLLSVSRMKKNSVAHSNAERCRHRSKNKYVIEKQMLMPSTMTTTATLISLLFVHSTHRTQHVQKSENYSQLIQSLLSSR